MVFPPNTQTAVRRLDNEQNRRISVSNYAPFHWHRDICTDLRCRSHHPLQLTVFLSRGPQSSHLFRLLHLARFLREKRERKMGLQNGNERIKSSLFFCDEPWGTNPPYVLRSISADHFLPIRNNRATQDVISWAGRFRDTYWAKTTGSNSFHGQESECNWN